MLRMLQVLHHVPPPPCPCSASNRTLVPHRIQTHCPEVGHPGATSQGQVAVTRHTESLIFDVSLLYTLRPSLSDIVPWVTRARCTSLLRCPWSKLSNKGRASGYAMSNPYLERTTSTVFSTSVQIGSIMPPNNYCSRPRLK